MRKHTFCIFMCIISFSILFAEAPELKNVMPNSWQKVTRLTAEEEQAFIQDNPEIIEQGMERANYNLRGYNLPVTPVPHIYKQLVGIDTFYRVLIIPNREHDFNAWGAYFVQMLIYQTNEYNKILAITEYFKGIPSERTYGARLFNSIEIIESEGKAKAILISTSYISVNENEDQFIGMVKGQLAGSTEAVYFLMDDILKTENFHKQFYPDNMLSRVEGNIRITASACLIDPNIPLRYGIQSAFDGNPATSYVENTEDDLMGISGWLGSIKIAIINGYAQNMSLYKNNNRVSKVSLFFFKDNGFRDLELMDDTLSWQFIKMDGGGGFSVVDIYKGSRYNDTCIAEYNVYTEDHGWLFGDIQDE